MYPQKVMLYSRLTGHSVAILVLMSCFRMASWQRVSPPPSVLEKSVDSGVPSDATRSAWNEAGTWEEVEKTDWCKGKLTEALRCGH